MENNYSGDDVKQQSIKFAEWCVKNKYIYYFNGETYMWCIPKKQEYYTSEELYELWLNNNK